MRVGWELVLAHLRLTSLLAALAMLGSLLLSYLNGRALTRRVRELESMTKDVLTGAPAPRRRHHGRSRV